MEFDLIWVVLKKDDTKVIPLSTLLPRINPVKFGSVVL